jgi:hypothetical protein
MDEGGLLLIALGVIFVSATYLVFFCGHRMSEVLLFLIGGDDRWTE